MRTKHKNDLYKIIQDSSFGMENFTLTDTSETAFEGEHIITSIRYKKSDLNFIFRPGVQSFNDYDYRYSKFGPGFPLTDYYPERGYVTFEEVVKIFIWWLHNVVKPYTEDELEPNLWEEFEKRNKSFDFEKIDFEEQSQFSSEEKKQVSLSLNELKLLIQNNVTLNQNDQKIVNARLDYLIEAANRLNKFDWKSTAVSTLIGIITTLSLDAEKGKLLFELFKKVFSTVPLILG